MEGGGGGQGGRRYRLSEAGVNDLLGGLREDKLRLYSATRRRRWRSR